jgi:NAD+ synthase
MKDNDGIRIIIDKVINSLNYEEVSKKIINFLSKHLVRSKKSCYVLGLSGGLDSSVTATLAAMMLNGNKEMGWRIKALIMPHTKITPAKDVQDAIRLAKHLSIDYDVVDITDIHSSMLNKVSEFIPKGIIGSYKKVADGNLIARIRMCILYYYANVNDALVLGTSDRSELLIGYYTKYGDGAADLLPIAMLYKSQVRALARYLMLDKDIIEKRSSPMLWQDHYAEQELGMSYDEIDSILYCMFDLRLGLNDIVREYNIDKDKVIRVRRMVRANRHKRIPPNVCNIK